MILPIEISPCPIIEAIIEIRFSTSINGGAIFGILYNELKNDFPIVENLPILQLPEQIRQVDPNLRFKPHYKISNGKSSIQIGPDVISFSSIPFYSGWEDFLPQIINTLIRIEKMKLINKVVRVGLRYINFFEEDIFKKTNISVCLNKERIEYKNTAVRTDIIKDKYSCTLQVVNNINVNGKVGSIIDIDTFTESELNDFFPRMTSIINGAHTTEKELFFSLLTDDLLKSLNPRY